MFNATFIGNQDKGEEDKEDDAEEEEEDKLHFYNIIKNHFIFNFTP